MYIWGSQIHKIHEMKYKSLFIIYYSLNPFVHKVFKSPSGIPLKRTKSAFKVPLN